VIHFYDNVKTMGIQGRVTVQYGDNCMSQRKVHEWVEIFKELFMRILGWGWGTDRSAYPGQPKDRLSW